jgi:hypothetical protein
LYSWFCFRKKSLTEKSGYFLRLLLVLEDSHDVFLAHDEQLVAVDLDGLARVFAKSTWSPTFNWSGRCVPSCQQLAATYRNDFSLLRLLRSRVGNHDAGSRRALLPDPLDDNPVV